MKNIDKYQVFAGLFLTFSIPVTILIFLNGGKYVVADSLSFFGSYWGGVLSPILSICSTLLFLSALTLQRIELKENRAFNRESLLQTLEEMKQSREVHEDQKKINKRSAQEALSLSKSHYSKIESEMRNEHSVRETEVFRNNIQEFFKKLRDFQYMNSDGVIIDGYSGINAILVDQSRSNVDFCAPAFFGLMNSLNVLIAEACGNAYKGNPNYIGHPGLPGYKYYLFQKNFSYHFLSTLFKCYEFCKPIRELEGLEVFSFERLIKFHTDNSRFPNYGEKEPLLYIYEGEFKKGNE